MGIGVAEVVETWNAATVRKWLEARVTAARSDQVRAERAGWSHRDDCDKATAEEMVCTLVQRKNAPETQESLSGALRLLLDTDDYVWRGVYDDMRFDRHVRAFAKKLVKMVKLNQGFENIAHYQ